MKMEVIFYVLADIHKDEGHFFSNLYPGNSGKNRYAYLLSKYYHKAWVILQLCICYMIRVII